MVKSVIRVAAVLGTRPEAIKVAPVLKAMQLNTFIEPILVVTGQHREMLDQVLRIFGLSPHIDLDIMQQEQSLYGITQRVLAGLEDCLESIASDLILVQGDTTTAFVSALASFYRKIPVAHIEAGLRTSDKYEPFPEEMNRRLISVLGDLHFAPTVRARDNLLRCGVSSESIFVTGNTVTDALREMVTALPPGLPENLLDISGRAVSLKKGMKLILVESHRRENLGQPMQEICEALRTVVKNFTNVVILFSLHKNPRVREVVVPALGGLDRVFVVEPLDYSDLLRVMREAYFVVTDSGGIQEEAPSLGKPVLVVRNNTERPEGVEAGVARLVGTKRSVIEQWCARLLSERGLYSDMSRVANPYGDGRAAERIVRAILYRFGRGERPSDFEV